MFKILRYYGPYIPAIVLAVALLFLQVNMDLALPDYMSRIVNIGLQQGGIESPVPEKISAATRDKLLSLSDSSGAEQFARYYNVSDEAEPAVLKEGMLENLNSDREFRSGFLVSFILAASDGYRNAAMTPEALTAMPDEQRSAVLAKMKEQFAGRFDPAMIEQMALQAVRTEYESMGMDSSELQSSYILKTGGFMLIIALISAAATIAVGFLAARVSAGVGRNLRSDLFRKIESFSNAEFDRFSTASLITRNTNDVVQIQHVTFMIMRMMFMAPIMATGAIIRAFTKAPSMGWIIALAVLVLMGIVSVVMIVALPKFKAIQGLVDKINKVAREQLTGILVVRAFNRQSFEKDRFDKANRELTGVNLFVNRLMVTLMPFITLIMNILSLTIIWIGAHKVAESSLQVGDMMAFLQYAMQIVMSFLMLSMAFIFLPRASVSAGRIDEVLKTEGSVKNPPEPAKLADSVRGRISFDKVSFKYPGADDYALKDISFTAEPGGTTAIIGSTGSGKSSLINLIPRFYDVSEGKVLIDDLDVRSISLPDLRKQIGYVPQKSVLFAGTIESNLAYGSEGIGREKLEVAARISQSTEFISKKDEGYDSPVSQGGANVSGGQKQRLSIARALIKDCPVLIFDDSFSALDFKTDAGLRRELEREYGGTTRIIVAQRVSTIMQAEQILVLDDGRLVGKGRHKELMENCPVYREIVLSQLSIKEV
ncbi:MAG: ABC transporter ATP-binding protein [Spirochaetales bacterium]|nr:ABC transporter ATP-binding protein [Spirochaetales bacterium]